MSFYVTVKIYAPYPVESSHTIKASNAATAAARAIRKAYDAMPHKRRIDSYSLTIKKI